VTNSIKSSKQGQVIVIDVALIQLEKSDHYKLERNKAE